MTTKTPHAAKSIRPKFASAYFPETLKWSTLGAMVCTNDGLDPFFLFHEEATAYVALTIEWMFSQILVAK